MEMVDDCHRDFGLHYSVLLDILISFRHRVFAEVFEKTRFSVDDECPARFSFEEYKYTVMHTIAKATRSRPASCSFEIFPN